MTDIHAADAETAGEPAEHGEPEPDHDPDHDPAARAEHEAVLEAARRIIATDAAIIHRLGTI